jgi:hypothetical protein
LHCRLPAQFAQQIELLAEQSRPKTAKFKKGGFLIKILEISFRKVKTTIDNHKILL